MAYELEKCGLSVRRQLPIPIVCESIQFDEGFRADLVVNDFVIVELKSFETLTRVHLKQLLTYIRRANKKMGLLINFCEALIKTGIKRVVNGL